MKFTTEVLLNGKTATGIVVPHEVVESFDRGKRPPVTVTINGYTYRNTIAAYGDTFMVGIAAEHRTAAGVAAGEVIDVDIQLDDAPREVTLPDDFAAALAAAPGARAAFDRLAYSHRKEHVRAVEDAKKPETRQRRIAKAVEMLSTQ